MWWLLANRLCWKNRQIIQIKMNDIKDHRGLSVGLARKLFSITGWLVVTIALNDFVSEMIDWTAGQQRHCDMLRSDATTRACDSTPTVLTVSVDTWHDKGCVLLLLLLLSLFN